MTLLGSDGRARLHSIGTAPILLSVSDRSPVRNTWDMNRIAWAPRRFLKRGARTLGPLRLPLRLAHQLRNA